MDDTTRRLLDKMRESTQALDSALALLQAQIIARDVVHLEAVDRAVKAERERCADLVAYYKQHRTVDAEGICQMFIDLEDEVRNG